MLLLSYLYGELLVDVDVNFMLKVNICITF